jgi:hypothetical protein
MGKTLAIILNHNLPEFTDPLYEELNAHKTEDYDLEVMDNGSQPEYVSQYTSIRFDKNLFWGGALNKAFELVLQNTQYDSLLYLNNDIEVNGRVFVKSLRHELFKNKFAIVSPCIAGKAAPWAQMQNWGTTGMRVVKWVDNQAPLFHRKLIQAIGRFDEALNYGWGQELICHDVCRDRNWKIGVCDHISIVHFKKQTFRQGRLYSLDAESQPASAPHQAVSHEDYKAKFRTSYFKYFRQNPLKYESIEQLHKYAGLYTFDPIEKRKTWFWRK